MGYTHYWSDLEVNKYPEWLVSIFNQAYQDFLRSWVTIDWKHINLFSLFFTSDENEDLFNEHFHEYTQWASWEPLLFGYDEDSWNFCKTARKSYDVAVVLALHLASVVIWKDYSSDGSLIHSFWMLEEYIKDELDCSWNYVYDLEKLEVLYDLWLNRAISYIAEHEEEMQKIEDEKQYDRICDLPDIDLEYIASEITKGITTIYLNNWQIVDVSFRR